MSEKNIVKEAIEAMKGGDFNCMPMPEFRDKEYQFETETLNIVSEAGYRLKWLDTMKGGCWHVVAGT